MPKQIGRARRGYQSRRVTRHLVNLLLCPGRQPDGQDPVDPKQQHHQDEKQQRGTDRALEPCRMRAGVRISIVSSIAC